MSLPSETQVLIVGAGPTGLVSAITLAKLGLQVVIVDSSLENQNGSRASVLHAHTLEVLDTIGLATSLIDNGIISKRFLFHDAASKILEFEFDVLRDYTEFPFALHIAQDKAEIIFRERLASDGIQLVRGKAVIGLREADNSQGMDVSLEDGSIIRARYVVGADGSRSTIRRLMGIEFKDPGSGTGYDDATAAPAFTAVLSDVYLEEPMPKEVPKDSVSGYLTNFLTLIPLPSHMNVGSDASSKSTSFWRVIYGIPADGPKPPKYPTLEYLQQLMDERNPWDTKITIASVTSSSRYRVRDAVATNYFRKLGDGYVLLAGDAAHVHAPVGGQGMNLGICDAVAVAHAIHSHTEAKNSERRDDVLKQYEESRQRIAIRVVALTKGMTTLINANKGWRRVVRYLLLRLVPYLPFVSRNAAWRMSGLVNRDG